MEITELAHWRYRVKALREDVAKTRESYKNIWWPTPNPYKGETRDSPSFLEKEASAIELVKSFDRVSATQDWFLAEARYMCELGQLQLGLEEGTWNSSK